MNEIELNSEKEIKKRPTSLTVLCVLTFITSGAGCISALLTPVFSDALIEVLKSTPNYDDAFLSETIKLLKAGWGYYILLFLFTCSSLIGAILMWKLKKIGFHFYALANLAILFLPTFFLGMVISWSGILMVAGFIGLYAFHLKHMS
jgi:hypothetical protein